METINIKGKKYVPVNERLKAFRTAKEFAGWTLKTIIHELTPDYCTMEAVVINKEGVVIANGFAREVRTAAGSMVNATSYVENCETSAWGRALGNLGIGIDSSICSAQELLFALEQQTAQISTQSAQKTPSGTITQQPEKSESDAKKTAKSEEYALIFDAIEQDINEAATQEALAAIVNEYTGTIYEADVRKAANVRFREISTNKH